MNNDGFSLCSVNDRTWVRAQPSLYYSFLSFKFSVFSYFHFTSAVFITGSPRLMGEVVK